MWEDGRRTWIANVPMGANTDSDAGHSSWRWDIAKGQQCGGILINLWEGLGCGCFKYRSNCSTHTHTHTHTHTNSLVDAAYTTHPEQFAVRSKDKKCSSIKFLKTLDRGSGPSWPRDPMPPPSCHTFNSLRDKDATLSPQLIRHVREEGRKADRGYSSPSSKWGHIARHLPGLSSCARSWPV